MSQRPQMTGLTFANNTAGYGEDVASFGLKYLLNGTSLLEINDVSSSQVYPFPFTVSIVDYDDQVMKLDSESLIEIKSVSVDNKVLGQSVIKVKHGVTVFDEIKFFGKPKSSGNLFSITSKSVNPTDII